MLRLLNWLAGLSGYRLMKLKTFTSSGTWTKPAGCVKLMAHNGPRLTARALALTVAR
jgi:hypothetical protein